MNNAICRICLKNDLFSFSLFELFNDFDLVDLIVELCNIQINKDDNFSQIICNECAHKIISAHEMRKLCIESDNYWRSGVVLEEVEFLNENSLNDENDDENCIQYSVLNIGSQNSGLLEENRLIEYDSTTEETHLNEESIEYDLKQSDDQFESGEFTKEHEKLRKTRKKYKTNCPLCPKVFSHTSNFKRHLSVHRDQTPFHCDKCSKIFDSIVVLYEHMKVHKRYTKNEAGDTYLINCDVCHESSPSYAMFVNHMRTQHQMYDNIKAFKCSVCEMRFTTKQAMHRHIDNIHENNRRNLRNRDKNFLCNTCGKKFLSNFHLDVHIRVHTGEKPFKCEYCDKAFAQMSGLRMHTYIHTGERPFACKVCGKTFVQYGHVREHMMTHTNDRPHVCTVCNHAFRVKGNLTAHMLIHSGKKPHGCGMCGKKFFQNTKLQLHIKRVHNVS